MLAGWKEVVRFKAAKCGGVLLEFHHCCERVIVDKE
jgi:hypothetical protein